MLYHLVLSLALGVPQPSSEVLTLKQAVELALAGNPEIKMAQAQEERARLAVKETRSAFVPSVVAGSGVAETLAVPPAVAGSGPPSVPRRADGLGAAGPPPPHHNENK